MQTEAGVSYLRSSDSHVDEYRERDIIVLEGGTERPQNEDLFHK